MSYFKPLRRKIGVITLVMACVFATGWVRSFSLQDTFVIPIGQHSSVQFVSARHHIILVKTHAPISGNPSKRPFWTSRPANRDSWWLQIADMTFAPILGDFGFSQFGLLLGSDYFDVRTLNLPYEAVVIPLTAISAFLLLIKPRTSTEKKTIEPIPAEEI